MINGLFGRPRSGKSYEAVRYHIIPTALKLRLVVTNIPINLDKVKQIYGEDVANCIIIVHTDFGDYGTVRPFSIPEDFTKYEWRDDSGVGPLFVVDEAHMSVGRDCKTPIKEYYSLHGHYGHDIILVSQDPQKINKDIKNMVEVSWRCVKLSAFGKDDKYSKKTYHGVPVRNVDFVHEEERSYDKQFFPFYKSHTQSKNDVIEATHKDLKASLFPHKKKIMATVLIGAVFSIYTGYGMFSAPDTKIPKSTVKPISVQSKDTSSAAAPVESNSKAPAKPKIKTLLSHNENLLNDVVKNSSEYHPLHKVKLHISGNSDSMNGNHFQNEIYFSATKDDRYVFTLKLSELYRSGYDVEVLNDCTIKLTYFDYREFIICDAPEEQENIDKPDAVPQLASNGGL